MANDNPTKSGGAGAAIADDGWEYQAPPTSGDDGWEYQAPPAAAAAPAATAPPKSWLSKAYDTAKDTAGQAYGMSNPGNIIHQGTDKLANWAQGRSDSEHEQDLKNAAAGKPTPGYAAYSPSAGYDLLARGARAISAGTSPTGQAALAATVLAPEVTGPAMIAHGGLGVIQGVRRMVHGNFSPENVGGTINSAGEAASGGAATAHVMGSGSPQPGINRGPLWESVRNRNPVSRGVVAYQRTIAPDGSPAVEQMDDAETIRRAAPYLAEEARKPGGPVSSKQPGEAKPGSTATPQPGEQTGVMQYRQHAQTAGKNLWENKIEPLTENYSKMPIDHTKVVSSIRGTLNPDSPTDVARGNAINDFAKQYDQTTNVGEAMRKIRALNEDRGVQAYQKALPDKQAEMIKADPTLEAKLKAADSMRDQVFDSIAKDGSPQDSQFIQEARKDWGALNQVSDNMGKVTVPTPGSLGQRIIDTVHAAARPKSAGIGAARSLWNNPNKLAAESSRLFGKSDLAPRAVPPQSNVPWYQSSQPPFQAPPGAPQAPGPVSPEFAREDVGNPPPSTPRGTIPGIKALLPAPASTATPPVDPYFRSTGIGRIGNEQVPITGNTAAGTRFAPKGLLPPSKPEFGGPAGVPPPVGFPNDEGMWSLPPRARVQPSWDVPPPGTATPAPGQVLRQGGLGRIPGTEPETPWTTKIPPDPTRPFPKSGFQVHEGGNPRFMWEREEAKAAGKAPAEKPTDEQYTEAKNALKTPATLEPEELQKHRATVRAYEAAGKEQTAADKSKVAETAERKTGTANDRPQVKYKPSEKAATMSEDRKPLGKEFDAGELTHEVERNRSILDNKDATEEEKAAANKFFEQHPDRQVNKTDAGATAAERIAARNGSAKPAGESKLGKLFHKNTGAAAATEAPKISTDSNGIKWAERQVGDRTVRVSIPKRIPDSEVNDYANKMLEEQTNAQGQMHSNLFGKKNSNGGAAVDQVFGRDKGAEEQAAAEHGERREANKNERLKDISENAQRVFEGERVTPTKDVKWLKLGAKKK